ncbi:MAG: hypothetical protein IPP27_02340 [Bacteroidetes bacterium]|nr:hypothetical protein [Bacteroidota bacterium]
MGWRHVVSSGIGPPVSPADFILIISGITSIKVLGEFSNQLDIGSLDNFILEPMSTVSYLPSLICANSFVNFEDQSVISATSWFWNLPGSSTPVSYDQNPENITYSSGGNYPSSLIVSNGCITDTILFNVSVRNEIFSNVNIELCFGDTYILPDGSVATISGIYQSNFIAVSGCDSTINTTVNIHELNNVANDTSICSGSNLYLPWGLVTSSDGTYNHTYLNSMGCDSIVTFNLTVLPELTDSFSVENVSCFEQSDGAISVFIQEAHHHFPITLVRLSFQME